MENCMRKGSHVGLTACLRFLLRKKYRSELELQEPSVEIPKYVLQDERPVRSLATWAKMLENQLVVFQTDTGEFKLWLFETALRETIEMKQNLRAQLEKISVEEME